MIELGDGPYVATGRSACRDVQFWHGQTVSCYDRFGGLHVIISSDVAILHSLGRYILVAVHCRECAQTRTHQRQPYLPLLTSSVHDDQPYVSPVRVKERYVCLMQCLFQSTKPPDPVLQTSEKSYLAYESNSCP